MIKQTYFVTRDGCHNKVTEGLLLSAPLTTSEEATQNWSGVKNKGAAILAIYKRNNFVIRIMNI